MDVLFDFPCRCLSFVFPCGDDFAFGSCVSCCDLSFCLIECHGDVFAWAGSAWLLAI